MYSDQLIEHPELQALMKKFPKIDLKMNMIYLGWFWIYWHGNGC